MIYKLELIKQPLSLRNGSFIEHLTAETHGCTGKLSIASETLSETQKMGQKISSEH